MPKLPNPLKLLISIIGCELVGIIGSVATVNSIPTWYANLNKPFFSPPNWVFGPTWTLLYALMGVSIYLIWVKGFKNKRNKIALKYFLAQLAFNFIWTPIFFGLKMPLLALGVIIIMWSLIIMTIKKMYPISKTAAYLLIPYIAWVSFATLLNAGIVWLN